MKTLQDKPHLLGYLKKCNSLDKERWDFSNTSDFYAEYVGEELINEFQWISKEVVESLCSECLDSSLMDCKLPLAVLVNELLIYAASHDREDCMRDFVYLIKNKRIRDACWGFGEVTEFIALVESHAEDEAIKKFLSSFMGELV